MDEIREQAIYEVLTAFPTAQNSVLSCVEICTDNPGDLSQQKIKTMISSNVATECHEELDKIQQAFFEKKDNKENTNQSVLIDILADVMCDGIQLFDDDELTVMTLQNK